MMALLDWLWAPLSGATTHALAPWAAWHARWMVLGWALLLPLGALAARYFKIMPAQRWPQALDDQRWWLAHRQLQWSGVLAMSLGLALAWERGSDSHPLAALHRAGGGLLVLLGWLQVLGGLLRGSKGGPGEAQLRGDHYDMTPRRVWFERLHKSLGWMALLGAVVVIALGLLVADAPRWMALLLALWWLLLAALAWRWQHAGRCIDTYQAIWGPEPVHPGNRQRPIGWGVRRPSTIHPAPRNPA